MESAARNPVAEAAAIGLAGVRSRVVGGRTAVASQLHSATVGGLEHCSEAWSRLTGHLRLQ